MNHIDILLLSFVSKNMKKLIKTSQKKRFESIRAIDYNYDKEYGEAKVYIPDERRPKTSNPEPVIDDLILSIEKRNNALNGYFQLNVSGKIIDFRLSGYHKIPEAYFLGCEKESVIQSIHNHFLDVFGNSMDYNWQSQFWDRPLKGFTPFLPKLKNVSYFVGMILEGHFADVKNFDSFISSSPVLKTIQLLVMAKTEPMNPESKFYDTESIHIHTPMFNGPDFLRHFRGKHIGLNCNRYEKSNLIEFVKRWKSGESFQNLEFSYIEIRYDNQFLNQILNEIGAKFIDATKQPPTYAVRQRFDWNRKNDTTEPFTSHAYVVRESDNLVASAGIQNNAFFFGVWDKTEEEFLRIVE
ncbi:unnamed protein product [Caenorhabditis nigoni]